MDAPEWNSYLVSAKLTTSLEKKLNKNDCFMKCLKVPKLVKVTNKIIILIEKKYNGNQKP